MIYAAVTIDMRYLLSIRIAEQMTGREIGASKKGARTAYFDIANRCIDFILKMTPIYMLFAGLMLWFHLRELRWVSLLLASATSPSGLAFLAMSALTFLGAVIIVLLLPSFLLLCCSDVYRPDKPMPKRVKWILLAIAFAWAVSFSLIGVSDEMGSVLTFPRLFAGGFALGMLGYALPGTWAMLWRGDGSCIDARTKFLASWNLSLASQGPARPASPRNATRMNAAARGGLVLPNLERSAEAAVANGPVRRFLGGIFLPAILILVIMVATFLTSLPILVYAMAFGTAIESSVGTLTGWILLVAGGMLTMLPAFAYLHERGKNQDPGASARQAFITAGLLALLTLLFLQYAPIKDRVFSILEIQSTRKDFFQISSPAASAALGKLGFPVFEIVDEEKMSAARIRRGSAAPLTIVQAWVGYAFGDTVLLCKRQVSERRHIDPLYLVVKEPENVCLPLLRAELRRMPDAWISP
ncbi:hypothetical protein ACFZAI_09220 [Achromobacter sp. NPDC008082]|uniref:hypothetical protein n=1 Tax=Achromobacter sp. NPDC008082 TaxID=3363888 RepID=UPI0036E457BC